MYDRSMPHFHVWIVEEIWRGRAGVVALVRLETNFEYRTAAVRSAPPGSRGMNTTVETSHGGTLPRAMIAS